MSYQRVGTYRGSAKLADLAALTRKLPLQKSPAGYEATSSDTDLVRQLFYPHVGALFPGDWSFAMVVVVDTNGHLPVHLDGALPPGVRRWHLVLQTNPRCWYYHDGEWERLEAGGVYELDPTREHASINWGEPRVHLVVDQ